jgi:hypothetical protein
MKNKYLLIILLSSILFAACKKSDKALLEGTWEVQNIKFDYLSDGKSRGIYSDYPYGYSYFDMDFKSDNTIKIISISNISSNKIEYYGSYDTNTKEVTMFGKKYQYSIENKYLVLHHYSKYPYGTEVYEDDIYYYLVKY